MTAAMLPDWFLILPAALAWLGITAILFALAAMPAFGLILLISRLAQRPYWLRALLLSFSGAVLLAPVPVLGHSPVLLPLPVAIWLALRVGVDGVGLLASSIGALTLVALLMVSWRFRLRTEFRTTAWGKFERWWRAA
jgi:hypothetical protein